MTTAHLQRVYEARPFQPFTLHLSDGRSIRVGGPNKMVVSAKSRIAVVLDAKDDNIHIVDILMITDIVLAKRGVARKNHNGQPSLKPSEPPTEVL